MLRVFRPWHFFLAFTAVVAVVAGARASRPAPTPPPSTSMIIGPTFDDAYRLRLETKGRIATDAAAGRLSLLEAAAGFRELDAGGAPRLLEAIKNYHPNASLDEAYCRTVIAWVQTIAPAEQADYEARSLRDELEVRLREGTLHLPEKGAGSLQGVATAL